MVERSCLSPNSPKGLQSAGIDVVVYTNGESTVSVEKRWLYKNQQWPISGEVFDNLQDFNHASWAVSDAAADCDVIHLNNVSALMFTRFVQDREVRLHHSSRSRRESEHDLYRYFPQVEYVTISEFQRRQRSMPRMRTIHHGIDLDLYRAAKWEQEYSVIPGRIAPIKGTHLAIEVAKKRRIPLKIAGEVQPIFQDYFDTQIKPHIDGKFIEYVGEAELAAKE